MKMLVVDDSKAMRTFLTFLGQELAFETSEAVDGKDGLDVLRKQSPFDVALVDWDMPVMNGLQFVQNLRQDHSFDEMKVMMVTTQTAMEKVSAAIECGANDYLMKPVSKESLEDKLRVLGLID